METEESQISEKSVEGKMGMDNECEQNSPNSLKSCAQEIVGDPKTAMGNECDSRTSLKSVAGKVVEDGNMVTDNGCERNLSNSSKSFACQFCERTYARKSSLQRHYRKLHDQYLYTSRIKMKCPFPTCNFMCSMRRVLRRHLSAPETHNITFRCYKRLFDSVEDFMNWKTEEEQKTRSLFIKANDTKKCRNGIYPMYYLCSRSGISVISSRKKTKKINGTCPAAMNIVIGEGKVSLIYHKTHVGHGDEWQCQRLSKVERDFLASKLLQGFSHDKILADIRNDDTLADQRIRMVTRKDLYNVMKSYGLKRDEEELNSDLKNTDAWVQQLKDFTFSPVLLYKPRGTATNSRHSVFYKRDYMLSIMTEGQKQMFEMLPASVVGMYCLLESNSHHFFLITFFVVDEGGLPFPVAYCVTSRTDDKAIKGFLNSLKDKIGTIKASLFISDSSPSWLSAWSEVMGLPNKQIMYFPHLKHYWKKDLGKMSCDIEKQETIYNSLVKLSKERDRSKFELQLKSLVEQIECDENLKEFESYFKENFLNRKDMWALCYYSGAGFPTVVHLEEMDKRIHSACFYKGTPKSVDLSIRELLLLSHKYFYEQLSKIYGETDFIEQALILSHTNNEQLNKIQIECDGQSAKWRIKTNDDESIYCVKKCDGECPEPRLLYCPLCHMYLDMYTCNCVDYLIMCTICEHIHAITRLARECGATTDSTTEAAVIHMLESDCETVPCENAGYVATVVEGSEAIERTDESNLFALVQV